MKIYLSIILCCLFQVATAQHRILFVTSSQDTYGDTKISAANHFQEIVVPYDQFTKAGFVVDVISPKGGAIPLGYFDTSDSIQKHYLYNQFFMDKLKNTLKPSDVNANDYDAIYYSGGGSAMYGVAENANVQQLARKIYENNGVVSAICHGTAGLAYLKDANGKSLYEGKKITGYPDAFERKERNYYKAFPFAMDEAIKNNKGNFVYSEKGWDGFYIVDGQFITGQDPTSAKTVANEIIKRIKKDALINEKQVKKLDAIFSSWHNNANKPGVAGAVLKDGKILYSKGFGTANLASNIPVTVDTKFQIGTLSKQITVFAILLLEEQGKLSLSDDIRSYIKQLPNFRHTITIKHLLSQSSGLHDFKTLKTIAGLKDKDIFTQQDALELIFSQKELDYIPGTKFSWTNSGLVLLAEVIKEVTGKSFADFCQEEIFRPLRMKNTLFKNDFETIISNVAIPYQNSKNEFKNNTLHNAVLGVTNLYTSVADFSRWYQNLHNPIVGSRKLIERLNAPATLNDGKTTFNSSAGTLLYNQQFKGLERGIPKLWTYSLDGGYASNIFTFPKENVTAFVFGNNNRYNGVLAMPMAYEVLGDVFPNPPVIDFSKLKTIKLPVRRLKDYVGNYWNNSLSRARKTYIKNDTLRLKHIGSKRENALLPIEENTFQMVVNSDDIKIVKFAGKDKNQLFVTHSKSDPYEYESYKPIGYTAKELENFSGIFYCDALNVTYKLIVKENKLVTQSRNNTEIQFTPIKNDMFLSDNRSFGSIRFKRDEQKNIIGFSINSSGVNNLNFNKIN